MKRRTAFVLSGVGIALACCFGAGYRFLLVSEPSHRRLQLLQNARIFIMALFTTPCQLPYSPITVLWSRLLPNLW